MLRNCVNAKGLFDFPVATVDVLVLFISIYNNIHENRSLSLSMTLALRQPIVWLTRQPTQLNNP